MYLFVQIFLFAFCPGEDFGSSAQLLSTGAGCLQLWDLRASSALPAREMPSCECHPAFCCPSGRWPWWHCWARWAWLGGPWVALPSGGCLESPACRAVHGAAGCLFDCCWPGTLFVAARSKLPSRCNLCV